MNCSEIQNKIDLAFGRSEIDIDSEIMSHINICDECRPYYEELVRLRNLLNVESFEVLPGELDDITFEKISKPAPSKAKKAGLFDSIFPLRWIWAPAAAAAVIILFMLFSKTTDQHTPLDKNDTISIIDWPSPFMSSSGSAVDSLEIESLITDKADLDLMEGELINEMDVNNLVGSLTDDEFNQLYNLMNDTKGSA